MGPGRERKKMKSRIAAKGIQANAHLFPHVQRLNSSWVTKGHVCVLPCKTVSKLHEYAYKVYKCVHICEVISTCVSMNICVYVCIVLCVHL